MQWHLCIHLMSEGHSPSETTENPGRLRPQHSPGPWQSRPDGLCSCAAKTGHLPCATQLGTHSRCSAGLSISIKSHWSMRRGRVPITYPLPALWCLSKRMEVPAVSSMSDTEPAMAQSRVQRPPRALQEELCWSPGTGPGQKCSVFVFPRVHATTQNSPDQVSSRDHFHQEKLSIKHWKH